MTDKIYYFCLERELLCFDNLSPFMFITKIPQAVQVINKTFFFLEVLKARESKVKEPAHSGAGDGSFAKDAFPHWVSSYDRGADRISEAYVVGALILLVRVETF